MAGSFGFQTSSFQRRNKSAVQIVGTKISAVNSSLHVSTGVGSLDDVIGGGLPLGSLCLIEEDEYGSYAKIIAKYFLADGAVSGNYLLSASLGDDAHDLLSNLPSPVDEKQEQVPAANNQELKIAWRYENISIENNTQRSTKSFDLSIPYQLDEEQKKKITAWGSGTNRKSLTTKLEGTLRNMACRDLIENISSMVSKPEVQENTGRSRNIADIVVGLKSLREDPSLTDLMDVHGILEVKRVVNLTSLKPFLGPEATTTYGFKVTKRKFRIEKLHLPPAIDDAQASDNPTNSSNTGCSSGTSKSKLDF
nr:EOG090X0ALT [Leptodora kindtii]